MVQGRKVDAPLNDTGWAQASRVYEKLKSVPFEAIFTSSLVRSQQTIKSFLRDDLSFIPLAGLDEISWGNQEGKEASNEERSLYATTVRGWREGHLEMNVGGGENPIQVMERQKEAMKKVMASEGNIILICMHGRAIRILLCWLLNYSLKYMDGFPHDNCCYYALNYDNGSFSLRAFNQTQHLYS